MRASDDGPTSKPAALALLSTHRPRNVGWLQAAGLLFGDWGTSRLYVLGLAFLIAGHSSFWLVTMMSGLILAVGWAYTQICRIYPDGGGVYTAARRRSRTLAVVGALLLFADYSVTVSLSVLDGFHYFGLPLARHVHYDKGRPAEAAANSDHADVRAPDAGAAIVPERTVQDGATGGPLLAWDSPGLWAIVAIAGIGLFNLMGPKHSSAFAVFAALGMVFITLLVTFSALPRLNWHELPHRMGTLHQSPGRLWIAFVSIVLALSGVEAIANLTGVMRKPVAQTARRAIWAVAIEVAVFNILLALCMVAIYPLPRDRHVADMLAYLSGTYVGVWGETAVRLVGGLLLLSAGNTAVNGLMSIVYVVSRDQELPAIFQRVNRFGAPWVAAILAAGVPILILLISHDVEHLADLYAIGVVGAVAINVTLCALHPRLHRLWRKIPMFLLGLLLLAIWVTLAFTKIHALIFVSVVMAVGLGARALTKLLQTRRGERPSLLRQAINEQLTPDALSRPKLLLGTYGSDALAPAALAQARRTNSTLVICFVRQVALSYKHEGRRLTIDTDGAALRTFSRFLDLAHGTGVPVMPVYDMGPDAAELMAENAAIYGCDRVLIGTSRQGALYHLIKGHFQTRLESLLPPEIKVEVISPDTPADGSPAKESRTGA
ncbi:MAG TPA: APC family permease [Tepidisphaeraceae bacterium]|jgi:amino acid transporter|nr:APC family permease [Tepidisphaeraceae bacterium]